MAEAIIPGGILDAPNGEAALTALYRSLHAEIVNLGFEVAALTRLITGEPLPEPAAPSPVQPDSDADRLEKVKNALSAALAALS